MMQVEAGVIPVVASVAADKDGNVCARILVLNGNLFVALMLSKLVLLRLCYAHL